MEAKRFSLFLLVIAIPIAKGAIPGKFFWKPRLGIDFTKSGAGDAFNASYMPNRANARDGFVVFIDPYEVAVTVAALAAGIDARKPHPQLDPMSAYHYTNSYRWFLRHMYMVSQWLGGRINFNEAHQVWKARFVFMEQTVPPWMRKLLFFVDDEEWAQEESELKLFKETGALDIFARYFGYPKK